MFQLCLAWAANHRARARLFRTPPTRRQLTSSSSVCHFSTSTPIPLSPRPPHTLLYTDLISLRTCYTPLSRRTPPLPMSDTPVAEPAELPLDSPIQCKKPGPFSTPKTTLGLWDLLELMDLYPAACEFDQPSTGGLGLCKAPFKTPPYSTDEDDLFDIISPASSSTSVGWSEHDSFKHIEPDQSKDDQSLSASALMSGKIPEGSLGENANHTLRPNEFVSGAFPSQEPAISSKKRVNPGLTMLVQPQLAQGRDDHLL